MAPPPRVVAVVAQVVAQVVAAERLVLVVQVPLPQQPQVAVVRLVRLQVAVVRVPLPPEVAALLVLVQGLVASRSLRSR